jgi:hypothetical protein
MGQEGPHVLRRDGIGLREPQIIKILLQVSLIRIKGVASESLFDGKVIEEPLQQFNIHGFSDENQSIMLLRLL